MTKAEFTKRLEVKFRAIIREVKQLSFAEIEGRRARTDAQTFADWLRSEMDKADAEPALKYFDKELRPSYSTPEDAARSLTNDTELRYGMYHSQGKPAIRFEPNRVNWEELWGYFEPYIQAYFLPRAPNVISLNEFQYIKVWDTLTTYLAAIKAETRAGIFADTINKIPADTATPRQQPPRVTPEYEFDALFIEGAKDRFLKAATKAGMIDSAGEWKAGPRRKWLIMAAWNWVLYKELQAPGIVNDYAACKAIAARFGETIGYSTFYQNWGIGRDRYLKLDGRDFYLTFEEAF